MLWETINFQHKILEVRRGGGVLVLELGLGVELGLRGTVKDSGRVRFRARVRVRASSVSSKGNDII